ncbi:MAG TPA: DUF3991 and TOPRIM domain-containing protein [Clostridia bacterium]
MTTKTQKSYRHFTDEEIQRANSVNLLDLARQYGFQLEKGGRKAMHAKKSGGLYIFKESNRFYHWTADEKGGPIDFVMKYGSATYQEAVAMLLGERYESHIRESVAYIKEEKGAVILPDKAENFKRSYWYLISIRGIDPQIVSALMNEKKIYQEAKCGNCVFVGYDETGTAKYCSMRGTYGDKPFKMDAVNSDKSYPFAIEGKGNILFVCESPIDAMSHATLAGMYKKDWKDDHRISLGCTWDGALEKYLSWHPEINKIVFALDNDYLAKDKDGYYKNWGQLASIKWCEKYSEKGYEVAIHKPHLKDFNQDLLGIREGKTPADLDGIREKELRIEFEKDAVDENSSEEFEP